jgi:hypothetical protein
VTAVTAPMFAPTAVPAPHRSTTVELDTIPQLLAAIDTLPAVERAAARGRVADAIALPAPAARAALGLLALDVAGLLAQPDELIVLPDVASALAGV